MDAIHCATHPDRRASLTCERCGCYACSECAVDAPWGTSVCVACKARGGAAYPLVWEHGSSFNPVCFARSARTILTDAPALFAYLPRGGVLRALAFSAWVALCCALSTLLSDLVRMRFDWNDGQTLRAISLYGVSELARQAAQTYALVLISAFGFHVAARALGGQASAAVALRATAYGSAFLLYNALAKLTGTLAPFLQLALLAISAGTQGYFYFTCLSIAAEEQYGIPRPRAEFAAGATVAALVPSAAATILLISVVSAYSDHWLSLLLH